MYRTFFFLRPEKPKESPPQEDKKHKRLPKIYVSVTTNNCYTLCLNIKPPTLLVAADFYREFVLNGDNL